MSSKTSKATKASKEPKAPPTTAEVAAALGKILDESPGEQKKKRQPKGDKDVLVYNPDDEPVRQPYGGVVFELAPNRTTEIVSPFKDTPASAIAAFIVQKWREYGVCQLKSPVVDGVADDPDEQDEVDEAEEQYLKATFKWATAVLKRRQKEEFEIKAAGAPVPAVPEDVRKAREWTLTNKRRLKDAGLTE